MRVMFLTRSFVPIPQVCADINGLGASVKTCANLTTQDINSASQNAIHVTKNIMGGVKNGTGAILAASDSPADNVDYVAAFLNEAANSTYPISYTFKTVWEIMAGRDGADKIDQALQVMFDGIALYSGWLFFPLQ